MALHALRPTALAILVVLAGCTGVLPGLGDGAPEPVEAEILSVASADARCVEAPTVGHDVESHREDGALVVEVAGNVAVPAANDVLDGTNLTRTGPSAYRLDVNTTRSDEKAAEPCPSGGVVHYRVTVQLPADTGFELEIRHDGEPISGIGAGTES